MVTLEELIAELIAERDRRAAAQGSDPMAALKNEAARRKSHDAMGFPVQPVGGSSTNSAAVDELRGKGRSLIAGAAKGTSFGMIDEIMGALAGLRGTVGGKGFSPEYRRVRDAVRADMDNLQQENPGTFLTGNIAGTVVPALMAARLAQGASKLGTMGRGGAIGAVEGALHGGGNADGRGVARQARVGALIGAVGGIAAPAIVGASGAVKNALQDPVTGVVDSLVGRANQGKAGRAINKAVRSSGRSPSDIADEIRKAIQQGQPQYRIMDALGVAGQRQASGLARAGGDAGTEITEFLSRRQMGQGERVGSFVEDAFGVRGTTAAQTRSGLTQARGDAADIAYDAARSGAAPVDVRGALGVIDARIGGMQGSGVAGDGIDGKLAGYRSRLAAQPGPDGVSRELSDFDRVLSVKQSVQDDIGAAVRAGRNNEARELGKLSSELDAALEGASDAYRAANDGFREVSRVIGSVDEGAAMSRGGRAGDNVPAFNAMNPDMQGAARVGYGDDLLRRMEANTSPTSNRAKPLTSEKRDAEAAAMAIDPRLYADRLARENEMWSTQNRALGGSRTADNLADQDAASNMASGALGVARSAGNMQFGDVAAKIGGMLGPLARGQTDQTRQLIVRALMSDDPVAALGPSIRQALSTARGRRLIEALLRQPMRESADR